MILSEGSVDELNSRLEKKVTPVQFRPNLVISGCAPFNEVGIVNQYINKTKNTQQKNKTNEQYGPHKKTGGEPVYSRRVSSSSFIQDTNQVTHIVTGHHYMQ